MLKGMLIFEQGGAQPIGELTNLTNIIATMEQLIPLLKEEQRKKVLADLSTEDLEKLLEEKRTGATQRLEP